MGGRPAAMLCSSIKLPEGNRPELPVRYIYETVFLRKRHNRAPESSWRHFIWLTAPQIFRNLKPNVFIYKHGRRLVEEFFPVLRE